jgi:hypothetical protein
LSRLGAFSFDVITNKLIGGGGFISLFLRSALILIYVDRACEIKGEISVSRQLYNHQLEFPGKGYFWVEINKLSEGTSILSQCPGDGDVYFPIKVFDWLSV